MIFLLFLKLYTSNKLKFKSFIYLFYFLIQKNQSKNVDNTISNALVLTIPNCKYYSNS